MAGRDNLDTLLNHYKHRGVKSGDPHNISGASKPLELPSIQQQNVVTQRASQYIEKFPMSTPLNQYLQTRNNKSPYYARKKKRKPTKSGEKASRSGVMSENELGALLDRFLTKDTPTMEQLLRDQGGVEPRVGPPLPEDSQLSAPGDATKDKFPYPASPKQTSLPALPTRSSKPSSPRNPKEAVNLPSLDRPVSNFHREFKKPPQELDDEKKDSKSPDGREVEDDNKDGKKALEGSKWTAGDKVILTPKDKKLPQEKGILSKWICPGIWAVKFEEKGEIVECKVQDLERDMAGEEAENDKKESTAEMAIDRVQQRNVEGTHRLDYDYSRAAEDKHVKEEGALESDLADTVELLNVNEFIQEARDTSDTLMFPTPNNSCVIFKMPNKLSGKYTPENPPEYYSKINSADLNEFKRLSKWNDVPSLYPKYIEIKPAIAKFIPSYCRLKDVGEDIQSAVSLNITPPEAVEVSANRYPHQMVQDVIGDDDESVYTGDALFMHPRDTQVTLDEEEVTHLSEWTKDINDLHRRCLEEMSAQNNPKHFRLLQPKLYFDKEMQRPGGEKHVKQITAREVDHMQQIEMNAQRVSPNVPTGSTGGPVIPAANELRLAEAAPNGASSTALTIAGPTNTGVVAPVGAGGGGPGLGADQGMEMGAAGAGGDQGFGGGGGMGNMAAGMNHILANQLAFFNQVLAMQTQMSSNLAQGSGGGGITRQKTRAPGADAKAAALSGAPVSNALVPANNQGAAAASFQDEEDTDLNKQAEKDMFEEAKKRELFTKARNNRATEVEQEFAKGVNPDTIDKHGNTVLHIACQNGHKRMIKVCLRWGANLNAQNTEGQTPLHFLFNYHYEDLGSYLISKGADDSICNNFGFSPYEGLRPDNKDEALAMLQKHKKKLDQKSTQEKKKSKKQKEKRAKGSAAADGDWFGGDK